MEPQDREPQGGVGKDNPQHREPQGPCLACDVLAKTVSAVCHSKPSFGWVRFHVRLSTCLNDFHSGLLSKGPEESADGDHDHHLRHHHRHNIPHYHWLWSSGQVGTVSHPKVQTLSNRTPDANQQ